MLTGTTTKKDNLTQYVTYLRQEKHNYKEKEKLHTPVALRFQVNLYFRRLQKSVKLSIKKKHVVEIR